MYNSVPTATPVDVASVPGVLSSARDTEVRQQRTIRRQQDVRRLHIAMNDPRTVRVAKGARDLLRDRQRLVHRQLPLPLQALSQRRSTCDRRDEIRRAHEFAGGIHVRDVRMLEPRGQPNLATESLTHLGVDELRAQHLDRHLAIEAAIDGAIDDRVRAVSQLSDDRIAVFDVTRQRKKHDGRGLSCLYATTTTRSPPRASRAQISAEFAVSDFEAKRTSIAHARTAPTANERHGARNFPAPRHPPHTRQNRWSELSDHARAHHAHHTRRPTSVICAASRMPWLRRHPTSPASPGTSCA